MKKNLLKIIKNYLHRISVIKKLSYLPGHFHSPVVMIEEIQTQIDDIFKIEDALPLAIDINEAEQLELLNKLKKYYDSLPFKHEKHQGLRYYYNNDYFSYNSGIQLFAIIRNFKPKRIIEIGSGFSSSLILDTNDLFFNSTIQCTFIEPNPDRLLSLLTEADHKNHVLLTKKVQDVEIEYFNKLEENDILFVDSSHVSKTGSDLNHIIFNILPILNKGVIIHFHDIFYPFEYPKEWVLTQGGFGWNESYMLRAFLMYNKSFKILFLNSYMEHFHKDWFLSNMPDCLLRQGGSLFIVKTK